jgi:hypothetical protein
MLQLSRPSIRPIVILASLLLALGAMAVSVQRAAGQSADFFFQLSGAAEVPGPGDPDGEGGGIIRVEPDGTTVCHDMFVTGIGVPTAAHIHEGEVGSAGPVVVTLGTPTLDAPSQGCVENVDSAITAAILANPEGYYVNVHNAEYPDGALRGQLGPPPPPPTLSLDAQLTGAAEVPGPGDPDGSGLAHVDIFADESRVCWFMEVSGIATATAAHIHRGAAGTAGDVVVTLEPPADGSSDGCVEDVPADVIEAILNDPSGHYVNVHNADFPDGALRGQLQVPPPAFFAELTGAAEVPGPGDPDARGFAFIQPIVADGVLCHHIDVVGIAPATAAHVHIGAAGVAGPVVVTLNTPNFEGIAGGCVEDVDPALLQAIIDDPAGYYVNVHNAEYPDGAVRGQLGTEPVEPPARTCTGPEVCTGTLPPGTYTYSGFATDLTFVVTQEWLSFRFPDDEGFTLVDLPSEHAEISFSKFFGLVNADPCDPASETTIPTRATDLIAWFQDNPVLTVSTPVATSVGGVAATQLDVTATVPAECTFGVVFLFPSPSGQGQFVMETGEVVRFFVLEVGGETLMITIDAYAGVDFETFRAKAQPVIDSIRFALVTEPTPTPTPTPAAPTAPPASPTPTQTVAAARGSPAATSLPATATEVPGPATSPGSLAIVLFGLFLSGGAVLTARQGVTVIRRR